MRRLGAELGIAAMSLYRHVANREAVLAAVVDHLVTTAITDLEPGQSWAQSLTSFATAYRRMLLRHPHAVSLLATHPMDVDTGFALIQGVLARADADGVPQAQAVIAVQSVAVFVLGHALAQVGTPPGTKTTTIQTPEATKYYDDWFSDGLVAMVTGFTQDGTDTAKPRRRTKVN